MCFQDKYTRYIQNVDPEPQQISSGFSNRFTCTGEMWNLQVERSDLNLECFSHQKSGTDGRTDGQMSDHGLVALSNSWSETGEQSTRTLNYLYFFQVVSQSEHNTKATFCQSETAAVNDFKIKGNQTFN